MRILLTIHHELTPDAGAPGVTWNLAEQFRQLGHDVSIFDFSRVSTPLRGRLRTLVFPEAVAWHIRTRHTTHLDVIDASTGDAWLAFSFWQSAQTRPLFVTRSHGLEHTALERLGALLPQQGTGRSTKYRLYHGGFRLYEVARSLRAADATLFLNSADRSYAIERLGVDSDRALVVRNGISDHFIDRPRDAPSNENVRFAFIGRYSAPKGAPIAVSALRNLLRELPNSTASFLGVGVPPAAVLDDFPDDLRERVSVVPEFANRDLPGLVAEHQILLFPSLSEGFGMAIVEAMALGLVPVVAATPGPLEIVVEGRDALVVPPGDPVALEQAALLLATTPELLDRLRRNARKTAATYSWRAVALEQLQIYDSLLEARRR